MFRAQIAIAVLFGGGILLIGILKLVFGSGAGASPFLSMGISVLLVGGPIRWWMCRASRLAIQNGKPGQVGAAAQLLAGSARRFWAWWLWLTPDGRSRD